MTIDTRQQLLTQINSQIKLNGTGAITGPILNNTLDTMVNSALFYTGTWSAFTSYAPLDVVVYAGNSYVAISPNVNAIPSSSAANWTPLVTSSLSPGGVAGSVQYNNGAGGITGSTGFTFNGTTLSVSAASITTLTAPTLNSTSATISSLSATSTTTSTLTATTLTSPAATPLTIESAGITALTLDTSQNATFAGTAAMSSSFKRNHLINGNMLVAQRGTSGTLQNNSSIYPSIDRFVAYYSAAGGAGTFSQVASGLTGFQYAAKLQRTSGNTVTSSYAFGQACETLNSVDLQGKSITLSFYAKAGANLTQPININIYTGTGTDQSFNNMTGGAWTGESTIVSTSTSITTGWVLYAYTGAVSSTATQIGFQVSWNASGTAGADESLYVTGMQLEIGTKATPYEMQIYSDQLAECQRYYYKTSMNQPVIIGFANATGYASTTVSFPVTMRTTPTTTIYGTWIVTNCSQPLINSPAPSGVMMYVSASGTGNLNCYPTVPSSYIDASAEL